MAAFTRILGVEMKVCVNVSELARAASGARDAPVLIDTPGINPLAEDDLRRLSDLVTAATAIPVLVLPAGGDALEAAEAEQTFARIGVTHLCPTQLDLARRYGALLAAVGVAGLVLRKAGFSPFVGQGLAAISSQTLARLLMPHEGVLPLPFPLAEALS